MADEVCLCQPNWSQPTNCSMRVPLQSPQPTPTPQPTPRAPFVPPPLVRTSPYDSDRPCVDGVRDADLDKLLACGERRINVNDLVSLFMPFYWRTGVKFQ